MRDICVSFLSQRGRLGAAALLLIVFAGFSSACGGCGSQEESSKDPSDDQKAAKEDQSGDKANSMAQKREVFGLPLPPSVVSIEKKGPRVHVKSAMTLDEIEGFFKTRLTDYELLRPRHQIRLIGLRDYMPEIYAYGSGDYTFVVYRPAKSPEEQAKEDGDDSEEASANKDAAASVKPLSQRREGEQVLDRTSDGKLLAPGARWGQPYTPPPGSPLDQKRYRSNFGRPYGQWILQ